MFRGGNEHTGNRADIRAVSGRGNTGNYEDLVGAAQFRGCGCFNANMLMQLVTLLRKLRLGFVNPAASRLVLDVAAEVAPILRSRYRPVTAVIFIGGVVVVGHITPSVYGTRGFD
jgi:hypothetical protein